MMKSVVEWICILGLAGICLPLFVGGIWLAVFMIKLILI